MKNMQLPVDLLTWLGALSPVALLLILLVYTRCPAVIAAGSTAVVAMMVAFLIYRAPVTLITSEILKGMWNSLSIMAVIFPAILIYEISASMQAFVAIRERLTELIPNKLLQILAIGWGFSSFLQGPSGFGVPVAVTVPLLIGIGVKPLWAVVIALLGHAWGNLFGTLGLGWDALAQQIPEMLPWTAMYCFTAWWAGLFTGALALFSGFVICYQYRRWVGIQQGWIAVLCIGGLQAVIQLGFTQLLPSLSVVVAATVALASVFILTKLPRYRLVLPEPSSVIMQKEVIQSHSKVGISMSQAMLPYTLLVLISLLVLLLPALNQWLSTWQSGFSFQQTQTAYGWVNPAIEKYGATAWFVHSGFFLLLATVISSLYYYRKGLIATSHLRSCIHNTWRKFVPTALSIMFLLIMSKVMTGSGQIYVLAEGTAKFTGDWYTLLAPLVGVLGAFMASSSVSSNILFTQFQYSMAELTHRSVEVILGGQGAGSAIGTMISPSKVLLATTTASVFGQEGAVFKRLIPVALFIALLMGIVVYIVS